MGRKIGEGAVARGGEGRREREREEERGRKRAKYSSSKELCLRQNLNLS